ncbi:hypothetical protein ACFVXG_40360 [Kitasatospora sp. NPDC058162]
MNFFIGAILLALLALAITTVALGVITTLKIQPPEEYDDQR